MIRVVVRTCAWILFAVIAILAIVFVLAGTSRGSKIVLTVGLDAVGATHSIGEINGNLLGPLTLRDVDVRSNAFNISVGQLHVDWRPRSLMQGKLQIETLQASRVVYQDLGVAKTEATSLQVPKLDLPVEIEVKNFEVSALDILQSSAAEPLRIDRIAARSGLVQSRLTVTQLNIESPYLTLQGRAQVDVDRSGLVSAKLNWDTPESASIQNAGALDVSGELDNLLAKVSISKPAGLKASMQIQNLLRQPEMTFVVDASDFQVAQMSSEWPVIVLSGSVRGEAKAETKIITFDGNMEATQLPEIDRLVAVFNAQLDGRQLRFSRLQFNAPEMALSSELTGTVVINGTDSQFALDSSWRGVRWPLNDAPKVSSNKAQLRIDGTISQLDVQLDSDIHGVEGSATIVTEARLDLSSGLKSIDLRTAVNDLVWQAGGSKIFKDGDAKLVVTGELPTLRAVLSAHGGQSSSSASLSAEADLDLGNAAKPMTKLEANWKDFSWPVDNIGNAVTSKQGKLSLIGTPDLFDATFEAALLKQGTVRGKLNFREGIAALNANWQDLSWPVSAGDIRSEHGNVNINGTPEAYKFDVDAGVNYAKRSALIAATGSGKATSLRFDRLHADVLSGEIDGSADVDWKDGLQLSTNLAAKAINPGKWFAEWEGAVDGVFELAGRLQDNDFAADKANFTASGSLRGYPLAVDIAGQGTREKMKLDTLSIRSGQSVVQASGTMGDVMDFDWRVQSESLKDLHPALSGALTGEGRIEGRPQQPRVEMYLSGSNVRYADHFLESVLAEGSIHLSDTQPSTLRIQANGSSGDVVVNNLAFSLDGTSSRHNISTEIDSSVADAKLMVDGNLSDWRTWQFELKSVEVSNDQLGNWGLTKPVKGAYTSENYQLERSCLVQQSASICFALTGSSGSLQADYALSNMPLEKLPLTLPEDVTVEGSIKAQGQVAITGVGKNQGQMSMQTGGGRIMIANAEPQESPIPVLIFDPGDITVRLINDEVTIQLELPLAGGDYIKGSANLSAGGDGIGQRPLSALLDIDVGDVGFLALMIPQIDKIAGSMQGSMKVRGSLDAPELLGDIQWQNGMVAIPGQGITLTDLQARLSGDPLGGMALNASAVSVGELVVEGTLNPANEAALADLVIRGSGVQILNTAQASVYISPDIRIRLNNQTVLAEGEVLVPQAKITLKRIPQSAIVPSSDQVIVKVGTESDKASSPRKIDARIKTTLGEKVIFEGFGLSGNLGGALVSVMKPGEATSVKGEIVIANGRYRAYGQNLKIETGRLLFSGGGISNPAVELRATRRPTTEVEVGVVVRGLLRSPDFTLTSNPVMAERNILSYLLLGRPVESASSKEKSELGKAALALSMNKTDGITERLREQIGLDSLGVETRPGETIEQEALVIGKYLTPDLYLSYGIGLFDPINTVRLQYSLNEHWKVVTESSGKASGGDILYSVESKE